MANQTSLHLPSNLPFPITLHDHLINSSNPTISKTTPLFTYSFPSKQLIKNDKGKGIEHLEFRTYESPIEGELSEWCVKEGAVIHSHK